MTTDTGQRIVDYIHQNNQARPRDLVRYLSLTPAAIHRQLNKLQKRNLIEKSGSLPKVYYHLAGKGLEAKIKEALAKNPHIISAYVFGSSLSGKARPESDFDLAVVVDKNSPDLEKKIYSLVQKINFPRDLDLSLVDKKTSPLFLFQIISTGKKIYKRDLNSAIAFEDFSLHNYYDTARLRSLNYEYLKQKFIYAG